MGATVETGLGVVADNDDGHTLALTRDQSPASFFKIMCYSYVQI
jgi:hypothetical protein